MRINKYLAHKQIATRREADRLIEGGLVLVNGNVAVLGQKISEGDDVVVQSNSKRKKRYFAYYKPRGVITHSPSSGEEDIETRIKNDHGLANVFPIGRLDKDSEGLIILTDDGRITGPLLDPKNSTEKEYEVIVDKESTNHFKKHMESGVDIEGYVTKPATLEVFPHAKQEFTLTITEGKKHQVRRMCAALGYQVQKLTRTRVASIRIDNLKEGGLRKLTGVELKNFLSALQVPE